MNAALLRELVADVGASHVLTGADCARYETDERQLFHGRALAVLRPGNVAEISAVVTRCAAHGVGVVPQGGNTGYCGGATVDASGRQVVVSLERLNRVLAVDPVGHTLTVEAGVVLADAQAAAAAAGCLLPLAMGSQGSCQIGGNLATNAGGLAVLKYGTARDLTLGLQAVLPDGRVLERLTALRKDNTGYDLKQLFIGAEGTLGIITAAVLKLFPGGARHCAWAIVPKAADAVAVLARLRGATDDGVSSFEYMAGEALALVAEALPTLRQPLAGAHHVLVEVLGEQGSERLAASLEALLADGLVTDAVVAQSEAQRQAFWRVRESIPAAEKALGGSVKHDVSVPLTDIARYAEDATRAIHAGWPGARLSLYGHVGDGNLHCNVLAPVATDPAAFRRDAGGAISDALHALAHRYAGSFSAEHGVGQLKRDLLARYGDPVAVALMRQVKAALDPRDLMNPGKLLPAVEAPQA